MTPSCMMWFGLEHDPRMGLGTRIRLSIRPKSLSGGKQTSERLNGRPDGAEAI